MPLTDGQREQIKLTSTFLNNIAVGTMVAGGLGTILTVPGFGDPAHRLAYAAFGAAFLFFGVVLHRVARDHLKQLDKPDS